MAGKRDEVFLLGEEEVGADPWSAPAEEPTATAPVRGPSRSPGLPVRWLLILGALVVAVALALLARRGGSEVDPAPQRAEAPALVATPKVSPIARAPRETDRPHRALERQPQRPRSDERGEAMEEPRESTPSLLAETASAPAYAPPPEATPEPAPEDTAAPAQAAPLPAARPEFGIER